MKEIKFRSAHYTHVDKVFSHFSYWGFIDHKGNYSNDCFCSPSTSSGTFRKTEEQFTGLKDKNGVDIYKGDIIKYDGLEMIVKFIDGCFCKTNENGNWVILNSEKCEIIGNIHQNK